MPALSQIPTPLNGPASRRSTASPNLVLVIVCAGVVLASLDLFIVNVALPQMARSFGSGTRLGDQPVDRRMQFTPRVAVVDAG